MKLTIVGMRPVEFQGNSGDMISGGMYVAFMQSGKGIEFYSSDRDIPVQEGEAEYNHGLAIDLPIKVGIGANGKVKYTHVASRPAEVQENED